MRRIAMTRRWGRSSRATSLAVVVSLGAVGCGAGTPAAGEGDPAAQGSITVFAAASLTDAFAELGEAFEDDHPGTSVAFNFAGSSTLREQILAGAPADVFASANESSMAPVVEAGAPADVFASANESSMAPVVEAGATVGDAVPFVGNELAIAVPAGNPGGVDGLDDLADPDLLVGLCAEAVPCGQLAREALAAAGVDAAVDTDEPDVRSLLTKLEAGDLDAGIVYHTDVLAAGDAVEGVEIPPGHNVAATYPIAALADAEDPEVAAAFVDFVLSEAGQEILEARGFGGPA